MAKKCRKSAINVAKMICFIANIQRAVNAVTLQLSVNLTQLDADDGHYNKRDDLQKIYANKQGDISLDKLFEKAEEHAKKFNYRPGKIGIIGQAGIGKTTLSKMLVSQVCDGLILPQTKYIFHISLREVDYTASTSLLKFLTLNSHTSWNESDSVNYAVLKQIHESKDILFVFDGFDEIKASTDEFEKVSAPLQFYSIAKPIHFIKHILSGNLFPNSKVVVTSRPSQMHKLNVLHKPGFLVEVLGLSEESQDELGKQICGEDFDKVKQYLINHQDIYRFCYIPVYCCIIMHIVLSSLNNKSMTIDTMSDCMSYALSLYMRSEHVTKMKSNLDDVKKLAQLAWEGVTERKIVFDKSDLDKHLISVKTKDTFLQTCLDSSNLSITILEGDQTFNFSHLTWMEFFAALYAMYCMTTTEFKSLLKKYIREPSFEVVVRFLYGLCKPSTAKQMKMIGLGKINEEKKNILIRIARDAASNASNILTTATWINESREQSIIENLKPKVIDVCQQSIYPNDASVIAYILHHSSKPFSILVNGAQFVRDAFKVLCNGIASSQHEV